MNTTTCPPYAATTTTAAAVPATLAMPEAWLVIGATGNRSVHLDHTLADAYAVKSRGVVYPLFLAAPAPASDRTAIAEAHTETEVPHAAA